MQKKTAIITGASRGIGMATAKLMALTGYDVVIQYNSSENEAVLLLDHIKSNGGTGIIFNADVNKRNQVKEMINTYMHTFGSIDVLINNAGISQSKVFLDISENEWDWMMDTHVKGTYHCTQLVLPYMLTAKRGKIINVSSVWGMTGASCEVHYSTAKAAIIGFTKALAKELAPSNIKVNCVAPGAVETDMMKGLSEDAKAQLISEIPAGRLASPEEVADSILFLASEKSNYITGQVLSPNGGFVI